jgi:hypothetical protein
VGNKEGEEKRREERRKTAEFSFFLLPEQTSFYSSEIFKGTGRLPGLSTVSEIQLYDFNVVRTTTGAHAKVHAAPRYAAVVMKFLGKTKSNALLIVGSRARSFPPQG